LDPSLATPVILNDEQFHQLIAFLSDGLLDPRAKPENLRQLVPRSVPSGRPLLTFEFPDGRTATAQDEVAQGTHSTLYLPLTQK